MHAARIVFGIALYLAIASSCATQSVPFVWVDDLALEQHDPLEYRIGPRDTIGVRVWNHDAMSVARARVREDGRISLPFLKDVRVAGLTPNELSEHLQRELVSLIVDPIVTVTVEEPAQLEVSVLGEVARSGTFTLPRGSGLLHALAAAGGLSEYADDDGIYVLRRLEPTSVAPTRIRFRYDDLTSGGTPAAAFRLRTGDVVFVE